MGRKDAAFRFAVGDAHGARSFIYRVWAQDAGTGKARRSDVYLAVRELSDQFKISLHESGQWQFSLTAAGADFQRSKGYPLASRHLTRWTRPAQSQPACVRAFAVLIPFCELRPFPGPYPESAIRWLPKPEPARLGVVCLLLCPQRCDPGGLGLRPEARPELLWEIQLASGEFLSVVHWEEQMFAEQLQGMFHTRRVMAAVPDPEPESPSTGYLQIVTTADDSRAWLEMAPAPRRLQRS